MPDKKLTTRVVKPIASLRREPTQGRAQQTISTIFEATAQIVEQDGVGALSTNKIAQKAGFSISLPSTPQNKIAVFRVHVASFAKQVRFLNRSPMELKNA